MNQLDGVAAQGEEVVGHADGLLPRQHVAQQSGDGLLCLVLGHHVFLLGGKGWLWQMPAVHLATGCQGQGVYLHICRRHHVFGQCAT